jgi:hypothetical protein
MLVNDTNCELSYLMRLEHLNMRLTDCNSVIPRKIQPLVVNSVASMGVKNQLSRSIKSTSRIFKCADRACKYLIFR